MRQGLEQLEVYQLAMEIGELVWKYVANWDHFAKSTVGNNFVRSADSVAYNISEGYGRHFFRDNKNFCFIARGSLSETKTGAVKALNRNLISRDDYESLIEKIEICYPKLNNYIAYIDKQINTQ